MDIQVTLINKTNTYKPISTIVRNVQSMEYYHTHKQEIQKTAIQQISNQRQLTWNELKKLGYVQCKARLHEPQKLALIRKLEKKAMERGLSK